jgi:hypothetical protein
MAVVGNHSSLAVIVPMADEIVVGIVFVREVVVQVGVAKGVRVRIGNVCQVSVAVRVED